MWRDECRNSSPFFPNHWLFCVQPMRNSQDHQLNSNQLITNESNERKKMWTKKSVILNLKFCYNVTRMGLLCKRMNFLSAICICRLPFLARSVCLFNNFWNQLKQFNARRNKRTISNVHIANSNKRNNFNFDSIFSLDLTHFILYVLCFCLFQNRNIRINMLLAKFNEYETAQSSMRAHQANINELVIFLFDAVSFEFRNNKHHLNAQYSSATIWRPNFTFN